jgi:hypothetical protein
MNVSSTTDNQLLGRLQKLYDGTKSSRVSSQDKQYCARPVSKKLEVESLSSSLHPGANTSFYQKYSKIWLKTSIPPISIKFLALCLSKIRLNQLGRTFRELNKASSDPIAFTQCPKCEYVGLTLLTKSTKDNFSPKFLDKIKSILPKRRQKFKLNTSCAPTDYEKVSVENSPKIPIKNSNKNSLVMYSDTSSPNRKNPLSDISDIQPNTYFLSSLSSPESFQKKGRENRIKKQKEEISFEVSRDSGEMVRDSDGFNLPKVFVPKLNFSELVSNGNSERVNRTLIIQCLSNFIKTRLTFSMKKLEAYNDQDFFNPQSKSKTQIISKQNPKNIQIKAKMISNSKKTAFKILNSRLDKFIYRRKMQGFYSISKILYQ